MLVAVIVGIVTGSMARSFHPSARGIELLGELSSPSSSVGYSIFDVERTR